MHSREQGGVGLAVELLGCEDPEIILRVQHGQRSALPLPRWRDWVRVRLRLCRSSLRLRHHTALLHSAQRTVRGCCRKDFKTSRLQDFNNKLKDFETLTLGWPV